MAIARAIPAPPLGAVFLLSCALGVASAPHAHARTAAAIEYASEDGAPAPAPGAQFASLAPRRAPAPMSAPAGLAPRRGPLTAYGYGAHEAPASGPQIDLRGAFERSASAPAPDLVHAAFRERQADGAPTPEAGPSPAPAALAQSSSSAPVFEAQAAPLTPRAPLDIRPPQDLSPQAGDAARDANEDTNVEVAASERRAETTKTDAGHGVERGAGAPAAPGAYLIQVGAFSQKANADKICARAGAVGSVVVDEIARPSGALYRVRLGPWPTRQAADAARAALAALGYGEAKVTGAE